MDGRLCATVVLVGLVLALPGAAGQPNLLQQVDGRDPADPVGDGTLPIEDSPADALPVEEILDCRTLTATFTVQDPGVRPPGWSKLDGSPCGPADGVFSDGDGGESPDAPGSGRGTADRPAVPAPVELSGTAPTDPSARAPPYRIADRGAVPPTVAPEGPALPPAAILVVGTAAAALVVLYRRLRRDELLDNTVRQRMVDLVRERPAANASEVADALDVAVNTVLYHVRVLEDAGLLVSKRVGGEVLLFVADGLDRWEKEALSCLRQTTRRALFELVADDPEIHVAEAARRLGTKENSLKYHVDILVDAGLIEARNGGRRRNLVPSPDAVELLDA